MTDSLPALDLEARLGNALPDLIALRQDIHTHPELGLEEERTSALVAATLRSYGINVTEGVGGYGVVGTLRGKRPGQGAIGLRADMDALSLTETTGVSYASSTPGKMHACGHDGHTAMLLGAAQMLSQGPDFAGTVHFIFQPAEEGRGGAKAMLADGLFERFPCDAVYGMHNMPGIPVGNFALRKGPLMASSGRWVVTFRGTGGHGGNSAHLSTDVTVALAFFIQALQAIISRNVAATETAVISVGHITGGSPEALNVMPSEMVIGGTMRAFNPQTQALLDKRMKEVAELAAATQGVTADVALRWGAAPLLNHDVQAEAAAAAAQRIVGEDNVDFNTKPVTAGEDFAFMLQAKPGAFIFIGNGDESDGPVYGLHTPNYNFNDAILPVGVRYWVELVQQALTTM
jgi:hippurate hydrolase